MMKSKKAVTIIELIMTMVVVAVMVWIGVAAMLTGINAWAFFTQRKDVLGDGRMALDRMLREIRMVKDTSSIATAADTTFTFTDVNNNSITFTISSGSITRSGTALVNNVTALDFNYYNASDTALSTPVGTTSDIRRIRIAITLSKGASKTLNFQSDVSPRNLQ